MRLSLTNWPWYDRSDPSSDTIVKFSTSRSAFLVRFNTHLVMCNEHIINTIRDIVVTSFYVLHVRHIRMLHTVKDLINLFQRQASYKHNKQYEQNVDTRIDDVYVPADSLHAKRNDHSNEQPTELRHQRVYPHSQGADVEREYFRRV
jgi:hypothetical protein